MTDIELLEILKIGETVHMESVKYLKFKNNIRLIIILKSILNNRMLITLNSNLLTKAQRLKFMNKIDNTWIRR